MNTLPGLLGFAPGTLAIWSAMLFGVSSILAYLYSMRAPALMPFKENPNPPLSLSPNLLFARRLYYGYVFSILLASFLLLTRLLAHDFRLSYVASYSGRDLPFYYLFSTFWAGQEG
ncbi:MAG TPA: hypothetical protein VF425_07640, partial [Thermoanaerobaculia bacterium]